MGGVTALLLPGVVMLAFLIGLFAVIRVIETVFEWFQNL